MTGSSPSQAAAPATPVLPPTTVGGLLRSAANRSPAFPALRCPDPDGGATRELDYAGLLAESERCARRLLTLFEPGDRIAVWADNRVEWVVLQFGAALAGLVLVTVNPAFTPAEAKYVLAQSRACACFAVRKYRGAPLADHTRDLQPELPALARVLELDDWEAFLAGPEFEGALPDVSPEQPVMIQYTSGTTGLPKGAVLLHGRLTHDAEQVALRAELAVNRAWLVPVPLFHTGGSVCGVLGAVSRRNTVLLMGAWSAEVALRLVEEHRIAITNIVPTMLLAMLEHPSATERDVSSLQCVLAGGAVVSAELVRRVESELGATVYIIFGQTECGPVATMTHPGDTPEDKQNTVGTALQGFEVKIVDPETGATVPRGVAGEFCARGTTMAGYFENDAATEAAFDGDGWLHTGDVCAMDERGYLRVEGRLRDMIIRGGENIYPRIIEEALLAHPAVADVAVVGLPDRRMGEVVGAVVVPRAAGPFDKDEVARHLRARLAGFNVPERWMRADELPRTATGKIQKFLLREQWQSGAVDEL